MRELDLKQFALDTFRDGRIGSAEKKAAQQANGFSFCEKIHAAFVLGTSVQFYLCPMPSERDMEWLDWCYPGSKVKEGGDQGARYLVITPMVDLDLVKKQVVVWPDDPAGAEERQGVAEGSAEGQPQAKTDGPTGAGTPK